MKIVLRQHSKSKRWRWSIYEGTLLVKTCFPDKSWEMPEKALRSAQRYLGSEHYSPKETQHV
jgi:hypothetical protein